jgi:hypothetical protein
MRKILKIGIPILFVATLVLGFSLTAPALGAVSFQSQSAGFSITPGSSYSSSDLFEEFKNIMPGDTRSQTVEVRNDDKGAETVDIYMRALGAESGSEEFLSKLNLTVKKSDGTVLFDDAADRTGGLTDWVLLGRYVPGANETLEVTLSVPITLGDEFQNAAGSLQWQFKVEGGTGGGGFSTIYTLTYESNGGTEYPAESYSAGATVNLDKTPIREGYTFTGWYADPELNVPVTSVVMDSSKTVYAGWEKTGTPSALNDEDHFAYIIGYPNGMVDPEGIITRAEVATIFFRLLKDEVREANWSGTNNFSDVSEGSWFNNAVSTMAAMDIVKGYEDGTFRPGDSITRAEFAAIAARFDENAANSAPGFSDISGHWASVEIAKAARNGWITGYPDGSFKPDQKITRAEAMALVNRVLNRDPEDPEDLLDDMIKWPDNMDTGKWYYLDVQEATNSHTYERTTKITEKWVAIEQPRDWAALEK